MLMVQPVNNGLGLMQNKLNIGSQLLLCLITANIPLCEELEYIIELLCFCHGILELSKRSIEFLLIGIFESLISNSEASQIVLALLHLLKELLGYFGD